MDTPCLPNREKDILYGVLTVKPSECGAFCWQIAIWCQLGAMLAREPRLKQKVLCGPQGWRVMFRTSDIVYYLLFSLEIRLSAKIKIGSFGSLRVGF